MPSLEDNQTTIAISKRNHETLSGLGKKGQSFDQIPTNVLNIATEYRRHEKEESRRPKTRVDRSEDLVAGRIPNIKTALECDSVS